MTKIGKHIALSISLVIILILLLFLLNKTNSRSHFKSVFAVYYGYNINSSVISFLNNYKLVILEPNAFNSTLLSKINATKIAYIDLGEYDNSSLGNCTINVSKIAIGYDSQWNQTIVNVSSPQWQNYVLCEINYAINQGFQGIMLDDIDDVELYPSTKLGAINFIKEIRSDFPKLIIGINRGFSILPNISNAINFVLYEDYGTLVNNSNKIAIINNTSQIISRTNYLKAHNISTYALAYANYPWDKYYTYAYVLASSTNVPIFITNWNVTALW